jgi:ATP-binding cassette subfamily B protein
VVFVLGLPAFIMFFLLMCAYLLSAKLIIPYLRFATKQKVRYSRRIHMMFVESLRSIRDVHLYSADQFFIGRFATDGLVAKRYDKLAKLLPDVPRYVIEPAGVTILFTVCLAPVLFSGNEGEIRQVIPTFAAVLGTLLRISAPLQNTFRNSNKLRGGLPEIHDALELLALRPKRILSSSPGVPSISGMMPRQYIQLKNVSFRYSKMKKEILSDINLTIPVGSRVAFVGRTGSGKTTLVHLLLGLYKPSSGNLLLDGVSLLPREVPAWQANCALVPQDIVLLDTSVRENVAFGVDHDDIDDSKVWAALEAAQFNDVVGDMIYGLYTMIGENGVKLSGGQRQRLSLARAFYREAKVLVLDEATSALDNKTENEVLQALDLVGRRCTTIVIAHRLSTIRKCDRIYEIHDGRIKAFGDFETLCASSESFREMTQLEKS